MFYSLYKSLLSISTPFLKSYLLRRQKRGKEDITRQSERWGVPSHERKTGKLVWFHAASVGESLSLLVLIEKILKEKPDFQVLITTGTVTSAQLMEKRLPKGAFHQYVPVDHPKWVKKFLDYWEPDLVIWAESEFWPNILVSLKERKIPVVLVNGRISGKSYKNWKYIPGFINEILGCFSIILAQNEKEAKSFVDLGGQNVLVPGNLKYAADVLPCKEEDFEVFSESIRDRISWLLASSHPGEEEQAIEIHKSLRNEQKALLTIIVPRHPERGQEILELCKEHGVQACLRSQGKVPSIEDDIYIADTLGEMGLFFKSVLLCCIGGSLVPHGGHNPIEPAHFGCAILYGPHMHNFMTICDDFESVGAARVVSDKEELRNELSNFIYNQPEAIALGEAARKLVTSKSGVVDEIMRDIAPVLNKVGKNKGKDV